MLEIKEFKKGEVVAFRLVTGDEILGEVTDLESNRVSIKKPCTIALSPRGEVGLAPACILGDTDAPVQYIRRQIVAIMKPRLDAVKAYNDYASNIVRPSPEQQKNIIQQNKKK